MISKRALGRWLMVFGLIFIMIGFKDSIYSYFARGKVDKETTVMLQEALAEEDEEESNGEKEEVKETNWVLEENNYEPDTYREENNSERASKGMIIIPKIDQKISIMDGVGGNNMFRGAGEQYKGAKMGQGNYVLASHRMKDGSLFARLEEVEFGDELYITDYETVWKYEVFESDNKVETSRVGLLKDTKDPIMTIYGCTSDGVMRVVKQAKLVGSSNIKELSQKDKSIIGD